VTLAAAEQSRRVTPPEIAEPVKLRQYGPPGQKIVLAESEEELALKDALGPSSADVVLAIGPEGGWTADELRWFAENGWKAVSLGRNILRAETAAIAATAIAMAELQAKENARPKPGVAD
jgi:16S rRNA (uracil1498-N3)-methyltransferase